MAVSLKLIQNAYWRGYKLPYDDLAVTEKLLKKSKTVTDDNLAEAMQSIAALKMMPDRDWAN